MKLPIIAVTSLLGLDVFVAIALAQSKDIIWRPGGRPMVSGEVQEVGPDFISIAEKGSVERLPVDTVTKVRFSDDPAGLASVRSAVETGQLEQADAQINSVQPSGRPFVQQDVAFYRALITARLALRGQGDVTGAARQMGGFLSKHPNSFRYYESCEVMGDLAQSLGRFDSAAKYYARLVRSKSPAIAARGNLLQGDALLMQGGAEKAVPLFQSVTKVSDARLQSLGRLGLASCWVHTGKAQDAVEQVEGVIRDNDSSDVELFARAYNTLGQAHQAVGNKEAALEAFLHTDLLFYRESERHAEALFHLSKLWNDVNKPSEAARAKQTLKQNYGASAWAKK